MTTETEPEVDYSEVFSNPMKEGEEPESVEEPENNDVVVGNYSAESRAKGDGWKPFDEYVADGNDPTKWREAGEFNVRGEFLSEVNDLKTQNKAQQQEFQNRLHNVQELGKYQLEQQKRELEIRRDEAIELADKDLANQHQQSIDVINQQTYAPPPAPVQQDPDVNNWLNENPWINGETPKASYAKERQLVYVSQGMTVGNALKAMKTDLAREYPAVNPKIAGAPAMEKGSKAGNRAPNKAVKLTYTKDELSMKSHFPSLSDKQFETMVRDSRGDQNA